VFRIRSVIWELLLGIHPWRVSIVRLRAKQKRTAPAAALPPEALPDRPRAAVQRNPTGRNPATFRSASRARPPGGPASPGTPASIFLLGGVTRRGMSRGCAPPAASKTREPPFSVNR